MLLIFYAHQLAHNCSIQTDSSRGRVCLKWWVRTVEATTARHDANHDLWPPVAWPPLIGHNLIGIILFSVFYYYIYYFCHTFVLPSKHNIEHQAMDTELGRHYPHHHHNTSHHTTIECESNWTHLTLWKSGTIYSGRQCSRHAILPARWLIEIIETVFLCECEWARYRNRSARNWNARPKWLPGNLLEHNSALSVFEDGSMWAHVNQLKLH